MMAPMEVPPSWSNGTPASFSALMMPIWAKPRAPPPASTRPTARPGDEARHPRHIAGMAGAQVMMDLEQPAAQGEMLRQHGAGAVGMQQQQFGQARWRAP